MDTRWPRTAGGPPRGCVGSRLAAALDDGGLDRCQRSSQGASDARLECGSVLAGARGRLRAAGRTGPRGGRRGAGSREPLAVDGGRLWVDGAEVRDRGRGGAQPDPRGAAHRTAQRGARRGPDPRDALAAPDRGRGRRGLHHAGRRQRAAGLRGGPVRVRACRGTATGPPGRPPCSVGGRRFGGALGDAVRGAGGADRPGALRVERSA